MKKSCYYEVNKNHIHESKLVFRNQILLPRTHIFGKDPTELTIKTNFGKVKCPFLQKTLILFLQKS